MATISQALATAVQHHQAGRLQTAQQIYRQILAVDPQHADALHLLGLIAHQLGRPEDAVEHIQKAIRLKGDAAVFHNNLGIAFKTQGKLDEAIACYRRALQLKPDYAEAHNNLGNAIKDQGKLDEAVGCYRRALQIAPDFAEAHNNLGNALQDQGKLDEALACYRLALKLRPDFAPSHNNLGNVFKEQGKLDEAVACFHRALELNPRFAQAYNNLGNALRAQQETDQAVAAYRRALQLQPDLVEAHSNLGNALLHQGKLEEAVACFRRAMELNPLYAEAHSNLGNVLREQGQLDQAIACFRRAIELQPDFAEAHSNLGNAMQDQGLPDQAVACYRRALQIDPGFAPAWNNLGNVLKDQAKLEEALACYRRAMQLKPDFAWAHSNLLYALLYCPDYNSQALYEEHRRWNQTHAEPLARSLEPHANDRSSQRRLRIGYISPDFRRHPLAAIAGPLFDAHDHQNFEIVCYADVVCPDGATAHFRGCADAWHNIVGLSDQQVADLVRRHQIDLLVDLCMHLAHSRLLVFARKPAPVQVCWFAYPGTTGLTTIDYRLTDVHLDPPGLHDRDYSEESIRLPDTFWCYAPPTGDLAVNALPALQNGFITFGSLNNFCKVNAAVLKLWARVLMAVDRSRLMLLAAESAGRRDALDLLAQEGITPDRVTFAAKQPRLQYFQLYRQIDIGLDTFPYNGHTTSLDSFWMGVPVVTLVGQTIVGRAGLSQLTNLGLPELAAHTPQQFVNIATGLAGDLPRLNKLRADLRQRMQHCPLTDGPRFARNIEAAYRALWQRWCCR